jgi:D-alanyl-D-alanine carboxypeptidase/D-alanyl-D-alanine-endopeptidase (penicillin-binding protein 4)
MMRFRWFAVMIVGMGVGAVAQTPGVVAAQTPEVAAAPVTVPPVYPTGAGTALGAQIAALLADPAVARAHWGIAVTAMDGTPLWGLEEGKMFRPASNAKLFTTAAAMQFLGPDATFKTVVRGDIDKHGTVTDLHLEGGGDANLDSGDIPYLAPSERPKNASKPPPFRDLESLADQLIAKGVKRVTGKIEGDNNDFPWEPYPEGWEADDLVWGYGAPVSGLTIHDNQLQVTIRPGGLVPGQQDIYYAPSPEIEQFGVPYYTFKVDALTQQKEYWSGVSVDREPGSKVLRVHGYMAADSAPDVEEVAIDDPGLYAAMVFRNVLLKKGVVVDAAASSYHWQLDRADGFLSQLKDPGPCSNRIYTALMVCSYDKLHTLIPILATHESPTLAEDVKFTLKTSQNLHAEIMLRQLGHVTGEGNASTIDGARIVRQFLINAGLDPDDFVFYDGSGLSSHDLVTPRATAQLLAYAATQPWFAPWKSALPVGGVDGSLASRFKYAPLKGHVYAKTGTLGESRALSGYVDAASGRTVIFSILVDNHTPGSSADRAVMDKIVAAIAAAY